MALVGLELCVFQLAVEMLGELNSVADQVGGPEVLEEAARAQVVGVLVAEAVHGGADQRGVVVEEPGELGR